MSNNAPAAAVGTKGLPLPPLEDLIGPRGAAPERPKTSVEILVDELAGDPLGDDGRQRLFETVAPLAESPVEPSEIVETHRETLEAAAAAIDEQIEEMAPRDEIVAEYLDADHEGRLRLVDENLGEVLSDFLASWAQREPVDPMEEALKEELDAIDARAEESGLAPSLRGALRRVAVNRALAEAERLFSEAREQQRRDSRRRMFPESAALEDENEELRGDVAALVAENEALLHAAGKL